jgi:hypothetical protein
VRRAKADEPIVCGRIKIGGDGYAPGIFRLLIIKPSFRANEERFGTGEMGKDQNVGLLGRSR